MPPWCRPPRPIGALSAKPYAPRRQSAATAAPEPWQGIGRPFNPAASRPRFRCAPEETPEAVSALDSDRSCLSQDGGPIYATMTTAEIIGIWNIVATVLAVMLAPVVALWIAGVLQRRADDRASKIRILGTLLSLRHQPLSPDTIRTLNLIDAAFAKDRKVREAWTRLFVAISDHSLNVPQGASIREEKRRDLILAICENVGLARYITSADVLRAYGPTALAKADELTLLELDIRLTEARKKAKEMNLPGWNA